MKFVQLQNSKGTRKFTIWGGVAIRYNDNGTEHRMELSTSDLFEGTVMDNVKALVGADKLDITRVWSSSNDNSMGMYIELDGAKYERIELNGWEYGEEYPALQVGTWNGNLY